MTQQRGDPRTVLGNLVRQRQSTYEELAAAFALAAADVGERVTISPRHLARLARGERAAATTTPAVGRVLQRMFGAPIAELLGPWAPDATPAARTTRSAGPDEGIIMAAERARKFILIAGTTGAAPDLVEQLRDDVARLAQLYPQQPLGDVLAHLVEIQEGLFTLLEQRQPVPVARQLYFFGALVGGMLAKASHDTAQPHAAMLQARTAVLCADQADHDGLRAWLRGLQSLVAYWAGRHRDAIRYAELGAHHAGAGSSSVWLAASAARAHAALGDVDLALAAIRRAETAWDAVVPDDLDQIGGITTFSRPRTLYYAADALAWTPRHPDALRYAELAVDAYTDPTDPAWAYGDQAGAHTDLALARIARRDLDGAAAALTPVLDLPPERRIAGILHSVTRVHHALVRAGAVGTAAGTNMLDAIEAYTRVPAAALTR